MPPHDVQHVKGVLDMLLNNSPVAANPKQREDQTKRLEELYCKLSQGQIKNPVQEKVMHLVKAIEAQDFAQANKVQMELATCDWDVNKYWLMGVKRLIPTR